MSDRRRIVHILNSPLGKLCGSNSKRARSQPTRDAAAPLGGNERWCRGCYEVVALVRAQEPDFAEECLLAYFEGDEATQASDLEAWL